MSIVMQLVFFYLTRGSCCPGYDTIIHPLSDVTHSPLRDSIPSVLRSASGIIILCYTECYNTVNITQNAHDTKEATQGNLNSFIVGFRNICSFFFEFISLCLLPFNVMGLSLDLIQGCYQMYLGDFQVRVSKGHHLSFTVISLVPCTEDQRGTWC